MESKKVGVLSYAIMVRRLTKFYDWNCRRQEQRFEMVVIQG